MVLTLIRLTRHDLSPPVFVAGTFTQWQANVEMEHEVVSEGSETRNSFYKRIDLSPGAHQYKFRLGHGDWWVIDDSTATVTDDLGNVNNVINVEEPAGAEVDGVERSPDIVAEEEQKERSGTIARDSTPPSPPSLPALSPDSTTAETRSFTSTNPVLEGSRTDTGVTTPLQDDLINGNKAQPAVTLATSPAGDSSASHTAKDDSPDDQPRGVLAKLLSCFSRETGLGLAVVVVGLAVYQYYQ